MNLDEIKLNRKDIFKGRIIDVHLDEVMLPNGKKSEREVVDHPGGVCIAALTKDYELLFVRQYRYPYSEQLLELPAGKLEKGSTPLENGKRELKEETGAEGKDYISLGKVYPSPGYMSEVIYLYLCKVGEVGRQKLDEDEFLNVEKIKIDDAFKMVMNGEIKDAKTQIAILKIKNLITCGVI